ncbi:MAG: hypothetical protein HN778_18915 [Prolixibacteraceae bacterium]|nr:hypothetical protein [Prolixibacteraceae bacterium]MBT6005684.1 hypothetical protein [Prolixibacteraceae bacterium]MBT6765492.1 hypothetical protein [Prolixibacteraceae bacterium]MBT6997037.1 hypothetical protein [Prolixibacteraceae bacterium]MBT7396908.1 hypothetical protein [Prolixibacteraceae bacterium]
MKNKKGSIVVLLFCLLTNFVFAQTFNVKLKANEDQNVVEKLSINLPNKLVPLDNNVYRLLDYYEAGGVLKFLPLARPYSKIFVLKKLNFILNATTLIEKQKKVVLSFIDDLSQPVNGLVIKEEERDNIYGIFGAGANLSGKVSKGDNSSWSFSSMAEPFIAGDFGKKLSFFAGLGIAAERFSPDIFFNSYVKDGKINLPYLSMGYSFHPYQFDYETMWNRIETNTRIDNGSVIQEKIVPVFIYHTEISGSWFNDKLKVSFHNQRRSFGYSDDNLNLSKSARRFPGVDIFLEPTSWMRYSYVVGSLFAYESKFDRYKNSVYEYDLGHVQKMLSLHMLELNLFRNFQFSATGGNIWSKRLELAYLMPLMFPYFTQQDIGDYDNLSFSLNASFKNYVLGKLWFSTIVDVFSFLEEGNLLKIPVNRYAWQIGWRTNLLSHLISGTQVELGYSRTTPFVYTHYPESNFNTFGDGRPVDMTYTHDGANLGFYLPPNSGEIKFDFVNIAIPDLTISLKNRFIIHGTNDLASDNYQIFGDVFRYQIGDGLLYPELDFTNDGFYDYTYFSELKFDKKVRNTTLLNYFRVVGAIGISHTWFEPNNSNIENPGVQNLISGSLGIIVDL